jgi:hypothetical protein
MTEQSGDQGMAPEMPPPPAAAPPAAAPAAPSALSRMSAAEQMVTGGAVLLLLVEIVFGVLLYTYFVGSVVVIAAVAVLLAAFIKHARGGEVPLGYVTVLRIAGFIVGIVAVYDLVYQIRNVDFEASEDLIADIGYYVGAAMMAVGAWRMKG